MLGLIALFTGIASYTVLIDAAAEDFSNVGSIIVGAVLLIVALIAAIAEKVLD